MTRRTPILLLAALLAAVFLLSSCTPNQTAASGATPREDTAASAAGEPSGQSGGAVTGDTSGSSQSSGGNEAVSTASSETSASAASRSAGADASSSNAAGNGQTDSSRVDDASSVRLDADGNPVQPNELGKIPVLMFHRFVEDYTEKSDPNYTTTFAEFESLLGTLYERGFRVVSLSNFVSGTFEVPSGFSPIVLTFDDGTASQFSLIRGTDGTLEPAPDTAVSVMLRFAESHPDFGLGGTFFVNMDAVGTFHGEGTLKERFEWLKSHGFELGSHTWGHIDFHDTKTAASVQEAVGRNEAALRDLFPEDTFHSLSLPYGHKPKDESLRDDVMKGSWEGTSYSCDILLAVGAAPSVPCWHTDYNPAYVERVRAQGRVSVEADLTWWLEHMNEKNLFISDGDPQTVTIRASGREKIDDSRLSGRRLVVLDAEAPSMAGSTTQAK